MRVLTRITTGRDVRYGIKILLIIQVHALPGKAAEPDVEPPGAGRVGVIPVVPLFEMLILARTLSVLTMASTLDEDVRALKEGIRGAWRRLADPSLTSFDRRETRNYMKEAELALSGGLKRIADQERSRRETETAGIARKRPDFRIIQFDA